jgi:hypothetical protein
LLVAIAHRGQRDDGDVKRVEPGPALEGVVAGARCRMRAGERKSGTFAAAMKPRSKA